MSERDSSVFFSNSLQEALSSMKNIPDVQPVGGCLGIINGSADRVLKMPEKLLTLNGIPELTAINKTERHIEFGAAVTIHSILSLGEKNLPLIFYKSLKSIATPAIRALITIGGHIVPRGFHYAAFAPLLALDSKLEIRSGSETRAVSLNSYFAEGKQASIRDGKDSASENELITRVRVPTERWDVSIFERTGPKGIVTAETGFFVFLVKTQRNILSDLRVAWASETFFRNREFENSIIGKTLPFSEKETAAVIEKAKEYATDSAIPNPYKRSCFFNFLENSLGLLT